MAGCRRGREVPEVGSEPLDRLREKLATTRSVSGRRGGRLPPWPDGDQCGREPDEGPSATVAGGPSFVRASVFMTLPKGAERVARLWAVRGPSAGEGWWRPEIRPGFVIMPLPEAAEAGSEVLGGLWGVWWLGFRRSGVWPGFVVMALAEGIEAGGKPLAVSGTSVGRPCFGRVGHFACFGENHPVAVLSESGVPVLPLALGAPRNHPGDRGRWGQVR